MRAAQVLLAWAAACGTVPVTTTSNTERMTEFLEVFREGSRIQLTDEQVGTEPLLTYRPRACSLNLSKRGMRGRECACMVVGMPTLRTSRVWFLFCVCVCAEGPHLPGWRIISIQTVLAEGQYASLAEALAVVNTALRAHLVVQFGHAEYVCGVCRRLTQDKQARHEEFRYLFHLHSCVLGHTYGSDSRPSSVNALYIRC